MSQFVTLDQAKAIATLVNETGIGGGVLPYSPDATKSGIFIPPWGGGFATPQQGNAKTYYFRFANGCSEVNAGLVQDLMQWFPTRWAAILASEAVPQSKRPWDV